MEIEERLLVGIATGGGLGELATGETIGFISAEGVLFLTVVSADFEEVLSVMGVLGSFWLWEIIIIPKNTAKIPEVIAKVTKICANPLLKLPK